MTISVNTSKTGFVKTISSILASLDESYYLTPNEKEVLAEFLTLPADFKYYKFSFPAKKIVLKNLSKRGVPITRIRLNSIIYSLINKKYLYRDEDTVILISPNIEKLFKSFSDNSKLELKIIFNENSKVSGHSGEDSAAK